MALFSLSVQLIFFVLIFLALKSVSIVFLPFSLILGLFCSCDCFAANLAEPDKSGLTVLVLFISGLLIVFGVDAFSGIVSLFLFKSIGYDSNRIVSLVLTILIFVLYIFLKYQRAKKGKLLFQKIAASFINKKPNTTNFSSADELRKWKQLYDEGTITEEMFNRKRDELIRK